MEDKYLLDITTEDTEYTITSCGNLDRPEEDQMKIKIKQFSAKDITAVSTRTAQEVRKFKAKFPDSEREWKEIYEEYSEKWSFVLRLTELTNFKFKSHNFRLE